MDEKKKRKQTPRSQVPRASEKVHERAVAATGTKATFGGGGRERRGEGWAGALAAVLDARRALEDSRLGR